MKHSIVVLCLLIISSCCFGQTVKVSGQIKNFKNDSIRITGYVDGLEVIFGKASLDKNGFFKTQFECTAAGKANFEHGGEYAFLFLTPGDSLNIKLDTKQFDETIIFSGKGAEANNYLAKKTLNLNEDELSSSKWPAIKKLDEMAFLNFADSIKNIYKTFYEKNYNKNFSKAFNDYQLAEIEYGSAYDKLNYFGLHSYLNKLKTKVKNKDPHYFDFLSSIKIQNPEALSVPEYRNFLTSYFDKVINDSLFKSDTVYSEDRTKRHVSAVYELQKKKLTGEVRENILYNTINNYLNNYSDLSLADFLIRDYKSLKPGFQYLEKLEKVYTLKSKLAKGKPAIGFTYPDLEGKKVSLSDLKGKYVYVDLWASWCVPCKRELPYSKKIVEKFKDKNIAFVFISIDENEEAWKNAVKNENIAGINLLAKQGFNAEVIKDYGVNGIPHYLLIDRDGNIISSNAKRPSGGIEQELEALLNK